MKNEKSKNNVNSISLKKSKRKFKTFRLFIFILLATVILCLSYYNIQNYRIYQKIKGFKDSNEVILYTNQKYLLLWNKNLEILKSNNKTLTIHTKNYSMCLNTQNIGKFLCLNNKVKLAKSSMDEFKNIDYISLDISKFKLKNDIINISLKINNTLNKINSFDIYGLDDTSPKILQKCISKTGDYISFNPKDYLNYMIINVPVKDINIEQEININRPDTYQISAEVLPKNATNTNIKFKDLSQIISIDENGILSAKSSGNAKFKVYIENSNIEKEINVNIIQVAEKIIIDKASISLKINQTTDIKATVEPENAINKNLIWTSSNPDIATVDENGKITAKKIGTCTVQVKVQDMEKVYADIKVTVNNNSTLNNNTTTGMTFIQGILVVNKKYSIPSTYNPGVDATAYAAFNKMKTEAAKQGISLWIVSGFRSYNTQKNLYNRYVSQYGQAEADTFSARPGTSEHQTGLAFDLNSVEDSFANTKEGKWLASNCHKYGFIIRYPKGKQAITGYKYEPWHVRYLGVENATKVYNSGLCLEEYLGI